MLIKCKFNKMQDEYYFCIYFMNLRHEKICKKLSHRQKSWVKSAEAVWV